MNTKSLKHALRVSKFQAIFSSCSPLRSATCELDWPSTALPIDIHIPHSLRYVLRVMTNVICLLIHPVNRVRLRRYSVNKRSKESKREDYRVWSFSGKIYAIIRWENINVAKKISRETKDGELNELQQWNKRRKKKRGEKGRGRGGWCVEWMRELGEGEARREWRTRQGNVGVRDMKGGFGGDECDGEPCGRGKRRDGEREKRGELEKKKKEGKEECW